MPDNFESAVANGGHQRFACFGEPVRRREVASSEAMPSSAVHARCPCDLGGWGGEMREIKGNKTPRFVLPAWQLMPASGSEFDDLDSSVQRCASFELGINKSAVIK